MEIEELSKKINKYHKKERELIEIVLFRKSRKVKVK